MLMSNESKMYLFLILSGFSGIITFWTLFSIIFDFHTFDIYTALFTIHKNSFDGFFLLPSPIIFTFNWIIFIISALVFCYYYNTVE